MGNCLVQILDALKVINSRLTSLERRQNRGEENKQAETDEEGEESQDSEETDDADESQISGRRDDTHRGDSEQQTNARVLPSR